MNTTTLRRQTLGCGYEPAAPRGVPVIPWMPAGWKDDPPTICAGYVARLPEVEEVSRLRLHWKQGALGLVLRGEELTEQAQIGIEILEIEVNRLERWLMTPKKDGGGGS